jgi:pentatricopeptide repeat domain-containing protein 1
MYAYSASLDDAQEVFGRMEESNMISWNILIGGLTEHGCGREAFELFLQMQQEGIKPDTFTHASILNSCASGGALEW